MKKMSNDSLTFYLILTTPNEIYDDWGENVSLDKMKQAIVMHSSQIHICDEDKEKIISQYKETLKGKPSTLSSAVLVEIGNKALASQETFNPHSFFIKSYTQFSFNSNTKKTIQNPEEIKEEKKSFWDNLMGR